MVVKFTHLTLDEIWKVEERVKSAHYFIKGGDEPG